MSTRCRIAKQIGDDKYKSIYCHNDGYFDWVGRILKEHYTDPVKVDELINLGDISSLRPEVAPPEGKEHSFENALDDVVIAYGRDRGETGVDALTSSSYDALQDLCVDCDAEYLYVFGLDNKWHGYSLMDDDVMKESGGFFGKVKANLKETLKETLKESSYDPDDLSIEAWADRDNDIWIHFNAVDDSNGKVLVSGAAKVFMEPSDFGIEGHGKISKINYSGIDDCNYDRGWDVEPDDDGLFETICNYVERYRDDFPYDIVESEEPTLKESDDEVVEVVKRNIEEAINKHNNAGGDITFSFVNYEPYNNLVTLSAYVVGPDGTGFERDVEISPLGVSIDSIYERIEKWADEHNSPDNFLDDSEQLKEDETLGDKTSRTNPKKYTLNNADSDKISELEKGSAFTWEGMSVTDDNLQGIVDFLEKETPNIKLPVFFYTWKGKDFNEKYGLTDNNAYPDDLTFLSIPLDNWESLGKLPFVKMQVGARWLDDIVDNNARRQGGE